MCPLLWPNLGCGVGLRPDHVADILEGKHSVEWLEVITENHMDSRGLPRQHLEQLRKDYPIVLHGVSLAIASIEPLNWNYLKKLKTFIHEVNPVLVSDHLCWTGNAHENMHQLLPLPRTQETLLHVIARIKTVQDFLCQKMLFENISTYVDFDASQLSEAEFLTSMSEEADCGILLDINNLYVNGKNHGYSAEEFLTRIPRDRVGQFHLAGHKDLGDYLFDAHNSKVTGAVWDLYRQALERFGPIATLIEWDEEIPPFPVLDGEVKKAKEIYDSLFYPLENNQRELKAG